MINILYFMIPILDNPFTFNLIKKSIYPLIIVAIIWGIYITHIFFCKCHKYYNEIRQIIKATMVPYLMSTIVGILVIVATHREYFTHSDFYFYVGFIFLWGYIIVFNASIFTGYHKQNKKS